MIAAGEARHDVLLVLPYATDRVVRHTDVQGAVPLAGENMDVSLFSHLSGSCVLDSRSGPGMTTIVFVMLDRSSLQPVSRTCPATPI